MAQLTAGRSGVTRTRGPLRPCPGLGGSASCGTPTRVGLCYEHRDKHYDLLRARGAYDRVDAAPVRAHLRVLRARGWSWQLLMRSAQMDYVSLTEVVDGIDVTVRRHEAERILALPADWQETRMSVSAVGTCRRMDALAWRGWPRASYAAQVGVGVHMLWRLGGRTTTSAATAARVARFYAAHAGEPGPCAYTRAQALGRNVLPPQAWTPATIDDPDAGPDLEAARIAVLRAQGHGDAEIARRLGMSLTAVERRCV